MFSAGLLRDNTMTLCSVVCYDNPYRHDKYCFQDEQYWKRSFYSKFPSRKEMGVTFWKGKFLSVYLQNYLEYIKPEVFIEEEAVELAELVSPYIYELGLNQMQIVRQPTAPISHEDVVEDTCAHSVPKLYDHIPLEPVLVKLYNLREISLIFGLNNLEDNYLPRFFEFSMGDCESLCRGLEDLNHLKIFRINRSNLDCSKVKLILQNLVKKRSIEELDFNHCKIGDYGMQALGGFIRVHPGLKVVRVANNRFGERGVQGAAYALQAGPAGPVQLLDFSLNRMSLECATMFAAAFVRCKEKPQTLIVNSCGLSGASAEKMAGLLSLNRGLTRLDMAANDLSGDAERTLVRALALNKRVLRVDLRRTHISEETQQRVDELLLRNKSLVGQEPEPDDNVPPLYLDEPEYLVWEYHPDNPERAPGRYPERRAEI